MKGINCIIIEDEPLAQERISGWISKLPFLNLLDTFDNGVDALVFLGSKKVDLIFLDINLGELSGIRLLETSNIKSEIIIISAYDEYALKGFELNVTDYLLKPCAFDRFMQAIEKVKGNLSRTGPNPDRKFIFVKTEHRLEKLFLNEVLYIEGARDYRKIHALDRKILTLRTFADFEQEIPSYIICRVHKSYMVSLDKIDSVERDRIRIGSLIIPISGTYKKTFFELIDHS